MPSASVRIAVRDAGGSEASSTSTISIGSSSARPSTIERTVPGIPRHPLCTGMATLSQGVAMLSAATGCR